MGGSARMICHDYKINKNNNAYLIFYAVPYYIYIYISQTYCSVIMRDRNDIAKALECTSLHMLFLEGCPWGDTKNQTDLNIVCIKKQTVSQYVRQTPRQSQCVWPL